MPRTDTHHAAARRRADFRLSRKAEGHRTKITD
jgi:hypothetical protein